MDRLQYLLQRYTNKTATPAELKELSALMDKNFEDSINKDPGLSAQQEERMKMRYQHIIASPRKEPVKTVRMRSWPWMAAAAAVTLIIVSLVVLMRDDAGIDRPLQGLAVTRVVHSGQHQAELVELPDGTKVILNKNSELRYDSATFGVSTREVTLTGEAYFDVTHDAGKRFVVKTGEVSTQVLGTAFNVSAYPGQSAITVTVERGSVQVGDLQRTFGIIERNEQIVVNVSNDEVVRLQADAQSVVAWKNNYFILDNTTFAEAAALIEQRFNVKVIIENESLKNCRVVASFLNGESLKQIVDALSKIQNATATINGDRVMIEGGLGCTATDN
ncbi:FecR domain-containing protein [Fulvivirgaceae bacterium PWU4]|uniref:FecR domain-containing protein n=1 Tax=Chryseosolibacter histidini TaxID=2782349 RepID=A0AAP2DU27_9BACT|nr:FecR domain-containing protein [Chryseosolibacter histidini]MBT1701509.1 FecR domain-containing protein [Chryseosolibacter histidini]